MILNLEGEFLTNTSVFRNYSATSLVWKARPSWSISGPLVPNQIQSLIEPYSILLFPGD
jgi:hypothetical protein